MVDTFEVYPEYKDKPIRSYVIRGGRMTDFQKKALNEAWEQYGLNLCAGLINQQTIFGRFSPLVVEVGFGMGDSLLEMAQLQPELDFIGIEVYPPGVGRIINNATKAGITNLRVYMADAVDVFEDCFLNESIIRFQLYFPDTWHKKKHRKRRIVQPEFMQLVQRKLTYQGVCHLATDWEPYAEYMMKVMSATIGFANQKGKNIYALRPDYRPLTKFEKRGKLLGHGIWDLLFESTK